MSLDSESYLESPTLSRSRGLGLVRIPKKPYSYTHHIYGNIISVFEPVSFVY